MLFSNSLISCPNTSSLEFTLCIMIFISVIAFPPLPHPLHSAFPMSYFYIHLLWICFQAWPFVFALLLKISVSTMAVFGALGQGVDLNVLTYMPSSLASSSAGI